MKRDPVLTNIAKSLKSSSCALIAIVTAEIVFACCANMLSLTWSCVVSIVIVNIVLAVPFTVVSVCVSVMCALRRHRRQLR